MTAIAPSRTGVTVAGLAWGLGGVLAFSFTVVFTRIAVAGLDPLFVGSCRAVVAAFLAGTALAVARQRLPRGGQWARLAVVAAGVVAGFPLLTSYALTTAPASHGAVVIALLPAATAVAVVIRSGERPAASFWVFAVAGAAAAVAFASLANGGLGSFHLSDLLLFGAVLVAAVGYAEGGLLSRDLGSWQTISWALVLAAPFMLVLAGISWAGEPPTATPAQWASLGYLSVVSMFLGFVAWYRGLAIGPMTSISQLQLAQPLLTFAWAALILGESITAPVLWGGAAVIVCAGLAVRTRSREVSPRGGTPAPPA